MSEPEDRERELQKELAEMSYLWTSGEWRLSKSTRVAYRIYLVFPEGAATMKELVAVRSLLPHFAAVAVTQLKEEVGGKPEYLVGELGSMSAHRFMEQAAAKGLSIRSEDATEVGYLPVSVPLPFANGELMPRGMIIDDDELAERLIARMLAEGVPVIHSGIEVDD